MNFAVVISKFYLSRFYCLANSLINQNVKIYILCFDDYSFKHIRRKFKNKRVIPLELSDIEKFDKKLKENIISRSLIDKIVTSRPVFLKYLFLRFKLNHVFLLDSDIFFFSKAERLLKIVQKASVAYCDHCYSRQQKLLNKLYGRFNGGFIYIKKDINGKNFLKQWSILCKKWCTFEPHNGKFSDQKYLENLRSKIKNLKIISQPGINLAPWNLENKKIYTINKKIFVNEEELIFFHFHGIRAISRKIYLLGLSNYLFKINNDVKEIIFKKYLTLLSKTPIMEHFWSKHSFFSKILKLPLLISKVLKNDFYIIK